MRVAELPPHEQVRPRRTPVNRLRRFPFGDRRPPEPQSARTRSARRCGCRAEKARSPRLRRGPHRRAVSSPGSAESRTRTGRTRRTGPRATRTASRLSPGSAERGRRSGGRRAARAVPEARQPTLNDDATKRTIGNVLQRLAVTAAVRHARAPIHEHGERRRGERFGIAESIARSGTCPVELAHSTTASCCTARGDRAFRSCARRASCSTTCGHSSPSAA